MRANGPSRSRRDRCLRLLKVTTAPASAIDLLPFDLAVAHELYEALFGPFKDAIKDKHLLVVPSGALTSLPLHVLVTEKPETAVPASSDYRGVPWLSPPHGMSVLPSVTSLKALRDHAKGSAAPKPYIGFGNPLLKGGDGRQTCPAVSSPAVPEQSHDTGRPAGKCREAGPWRARRRCAAASADPVARKHRRAMRCGADPRSLGKRHSARGQGDRTECEGAERERRARQLPRPPLCHARAPSSRDGEPCTRYRRGSAAADPARSRRARRTTGF